VEDLDVMKIRRSQCPASVQLVGRVGDNSEGPFLKNESGMMCFVMPSQCERACFVVERGSRRLDATCQRLSIATADLT
jgi:hypothetical protein